MDNNEQIKAKDLLRLGHYENYRASLNGLKKVRDSFGIKPHGKVFWWQYVTIHNKGVSLKKLIEIFNNANGTWQWKEIKQEIIDEKENKQNG
jgi:hypothetical protein